MEQKNNQPQIIIRPEFDKLKTELTKIHETAIKIQNRQIKIINTANDINTKLKASIEANIKDNNVLTQTEERIKVLQGRIDKSKVRLNNIREKILKLKKISKTNTTQKENNKI